MVAPCPAHAQHALVATGVDTSRLPAPLLTLRPEPGLEELATSVAAVLELRTGRRVVVGDPPPPGVLEAVPAGHVALARDGDAVRVVLGAAGGRSVDTRLSLGADDVGATARALALAVEALRDEAGDLARRLPAPTRPPAPPPEPAPAVAVPTPARPPHDDRVVGGELPASGGDFLGSVQPLAWARVYGGASTASGTLMTGVGMGLGLCVEGYCMVVAGDLPANDGTARQLDVRYRYPTFSSSFYARPVSFGRLTPGASLGFFTRLGHFEADMGLGDDGLETDLGARGSLEVAYEVLPGFDLMTEAGLDFTIDRHQLSAGFTLRDRGDRWSPWLQTALRYRP